MESSKKVYEIGYLYEMRQRCLKKLNGEERIKVKNETNILEVIQLNSTEEDKSMRRRKISYSES